jgi:hypothetical protein
MQRGMVESTNDKHTSNESHEKPIFHGEYGGDESISHAYFNEKNEYMKEMETKLNNEIGYRFWKRYVNAAFWSYLSMPINLSITMLTALSTGQATTDNLLPKTIYVNVALATLVLSVLNTYFRPYIQMTKNVELMNKWNDLGCEFESIMYSENKHLSHVEYRLKKYEKLMQSVNDLKKQEVLETQNFLTDSIYLGIRSVNWCLKDRDSWLSLDESYKRHAIERNRVNVETEITEFDRTKYIDSSANVMEYVLHAKPNDPFKKAVLHSVAANRLATHPRKYRTYMTDLSGNAELFEHAV